MSNSQVAQEQIRNSIVRLFGIDRLPEEKQEETINKIGRMIFQSVLIRVLPMLTEEEAQEYEKLIDRNVMPDEMMDFFFAKIPNFMQIVSEESETFRRESAEVLKQMK